LNVTPTTLLATIRFNLLRRPLMHFAVAEECLDIKRPRLNALIESGELPWAWNLGHGTARKEIRILALCVVERATGQVPSIGATRNLKLPEVVNLVLPQRRENLRAVEIQRLFHIGEDSIRDLQAAGEIKRVPEKLPAQGPNASPRYTRASLVKLLERRRMA
jgi:hypothetical protein